MAKLQNIAFGIRAGYHRTLGTSPAQAVFGRDMIMPTQQEFNLEKRLQRKFKQMLEDNQRENAQCTTTNYTRGDLVMLKNDAGELPKRSPRFLGPFEITEIQETGNVVIKRKTNLFETVNIRWLKPYRRGGRNAV